MGKPRLIIIVRHAQSEGNKDKTIHQSVPDHKVGLTAEGHQQAREAGEKLRALLRTDDTLHFFISPYKRTRQTTEGILYGLCSNEPVPSPFQRSRIKVYEEPRLREQDFGNFQPGTEEVERLWRERAAYGHFFYRIPNGESGADVYDRVSSFNGSLWRRFAEDDFASVAVLVTHGLCSRVFLMAWYHYSVEFFEDLRNINHCEFLVMKLGSNGRYVLQNQLRRWSDLKRERAARKSISSASSPSPAELNIPVRRWVSQTSADDATGSTFEKRSVPPNTTGLVQDETEDKRHDLDHQTGSECAVIEDKNKEVKENPQPRAQKGTDLHQSLQQLSLGSRKKRPEFDEGLKPYLGRDGGGSWSGAASPHTLSEDDDDATDTRSPAQDSDRIDIPGPTCQPRSSARALTAGCDVSGRVLADALGDQSDAEVDEADREIGTKEREKAEMDQILEEERRERSFVDGIY